MALRLNPILRLMINTHIKNLCYRYKFNFPFDFAYSECALSNILKIDSISLNEVTNESSNNTN